MLIECGFSVIILEIEPIKVILLVLHFSLHRVVFYVLDISDMEASSEVRRDF